MATGSFSDYAKHIGASPAYVSKLKRQGRLVMREVDGKQVVDFELSDRLVRNTTDLGRAGNGRNASPNAASTRPVAPLAETGRIDVVFRQAQAQERAYAAKIEELKYKELAGQLIRVDAVRAAWARHITRARDALLQIPHRLAPVLAAESDMERVAQLLEDELRHALDELSRGEESQGGDGGRH